MVLHRRPGNPQYLSCLNLGPTQPMHQDHRHPLPLRQPGQSSRQPRFHLRHTRRRNSGQRRGTATNPTSPTATHPIQVPNRVLHRTDLCPVLPRIRQRFRRRLNPIGATKASHKHLLQPWLHPRHKLIKRPREARNFLLVSLAQQAVPPAGLTNRSGNSHQMTTRISQAHQTPTREPAISTALDTGRNLQSDAGRDAPGS